MLNNDEIDLVYAQNIEAPLGVSWVHHFGHAIEAAVLAQLREGGVELPEEISIGEPDYNAEAEGCGLEDHCIRDRYEALAHGWQQGVFRTLEQVPDEPLCTVADALDYGDRRAASARVQALKDADQVAGPEDSYRDEWFAAKADSSKRIRAMLEAAPKGKQ